MHGCSCCGRFHTARCVTPKALLCRGHWLSVKALQIALQRTVCCNNEDCTDGRNTGAFCALPRDNGVGLAAPQVGVNIRLMVFNSMGPEGRGVEEQEIVLVNPKVVSYSDRLSNFTEGCLSFPGVSGNVRVRSLG